MVPKGLRMGTPAMTTRGFVERDFILVADLVDSAINATISIMKSNPHLTKVRDFENFLSGPNAIDELEPIKRRVVDLCKSFPTVGYSESDMVYKD